MCSTYTTRTCFSSNDSTEWFLGGVCRIQLQVTEQAEIPLMVKSSVPISVVRRAEYRQQDVFDTVVDLLSIQTPLFNTNGSFIEKGESAPGYRPITAGLK